MTGILLTSIRRLPEGKEKQIETLEIGCIYLAISFLSRKDRKPKYNETELSHIKNSTELKMQSGYEEPSLIPSFDYVGFIKNNTEWWLRLGVNESQLASIDVIRRMRLDFRNIYFSE